MDRRRHALIIKWTLIDGRAQMSWVRVPQPPRRCNLTSRDKGEFACLAS